MARPSVVNPLSYLFSREVNDKVNYCKRLVNARFEGSENLFRKDLLSHYGCVNAIEFSNQGDLLVSGGDDKRVLLWNVEKAIQGRCKPSVMKVQHVSNIFCLGYDNNKTKIFSAGNDDQVIVHDLQTGDVLNFFLHEKPVYGLSIHPHNGNVFASACDDGRILIYDIRNSSALETFCLAQYKTAFHSVMFNPAEPRMLATANAKEGASMWDIRKPMEAIFRYGSESPAESCMNVRFNAAGNRLLALRRRLPPILFSVDSSTPLCQFDHPGYYNSCTMKSCCFAGDNDEYVLSGSDDFNLYMWRIPREGVKWVGKAHMVLRGHRSIVNQVRYNPASCILASSGVEKIIKIWSPFSLGCDSLGGLKIDAGKQERQRRVFTHDEYIGLVLRSGQFMTHDYSHQSTREDPRMMAFFDSLVQREIEGWSSEDIPNNMHAPSDSENNPLAVQAPFTGSDSDDSTVSEHRLMLSILESTVNTHSPPIAGVAPERSYESPNRISLLIANRREKLMRLAALNSGSSNRNDRQQTSSSSARKKKSKSKIKSKGVKRKHSRVSESRRESDKKSLVKIKVTNTSTDDTSDSEHEQQQQQQPIIDTAQPSTSTGVISRRLRYTGTPLETETRYSSSSRSDSTTDDEGIVEKRRLIRNKSEMQPKMNRSKYSKYRKCKGACGKRGPRSKSKRQRLEKKENEEQENQEDEEEREEQDELPLIEALCNEYNNGNRARTTTRLQPSETSSTPVKKLCKVPCTPDSGITSGLSTVEKCVERNGTSNCNGTESSDHEQKLKNLECFRKKVDVARRSYRNRGTSNTRVSTTTDSSD